MNANWNDDGWNVEANPVSNPNKWNTDNRVVSRYFLSSPLYILERGFAKDALTPAASHASYLLDDASEFLVLFIGYQLCLPCYLQEEAQRIRDAYGHTEKCGLAPRLREARLTQCFKEIEQEGIYTRTDTEAFIARHVAPHREPGSIEVL